MLSGALLGAAAMVTPACGGDGDDPPTKTSDASQPDSSEMQGDMGTDALVAEDVSTEPDPQQDYGGGFNNVNNVNDVNDVNDINVKQNT